MSVSRVRFETYHIVKPVFSETRLRRENILTIPNLSILELGAFGSGTLKTMSIRPQVPPLAPSNVCTAFGVRNRDGLSNPDHQ